MESSLKADFVFLKKARLWWAAYRLRPLVAFRNYVCAMIISVDINRAYLFAGALALEVQLPKN